MDITEKTISYCIVGFLITIIVMIGFIMYDQNRNTDIREQLIESWNKDLGIKADQLRIKD